MAAAFPRMLKQTITWWASTPDTHGGFTYAAPVTMLARWEDKTELFLSRGGNEIASRAVVFVSQDVGVEDFLAMGDQTIHADPSGLPGVHQVKRFDKIPDMRSSSNLLVAYMV